jgi:acetyl esterase/lipase
MFPKCILLSLLIISILDLSAQDSSFTYKEVIYGRKDGMALTMIVAEPKEKKNGAVIIYVVSGGWSSNIGGFVQHHFENWKELRLFSRSMAVNGYTVIYVGHGSQPRYTVPETIVDIQKAVRFIRFNAKAYSIDPGKIGVYGGSSGGHLALCVGMMDGKGDPNAEDMVGRQSSKVNAVVCLAPPSDFMNYRFDGDNVMYNGMLQMYKQTAPAFDFNTWDTASFSYVHFKDTTGINRVIREISPYNVITGDDPPVLIIHGDTDKIVPFRQSERFIAKMKQQNLPCQLIVQKGRGHNDMEEDIPAIVTWFNTYLK